jgi:2-dehydro-3-deoxyphosphogluconate aldolase/(4S)-4-hydroxy-2-oxoglutarate aldolase
MDLREFKRLPVLGIMRGIKPSDVNPLVDAVSSAGLKTIEITMNTKGAAALIREAVKAAGKRLTIGAGTVTDTKTLKQALGAGAKFVVMPVLAGDVVSYCVKSKIPCFPGALSPQEVFDAWEAGATMVKVFPSGFFGPGYFKELKGPFDGIELMACGGVTPDNMKDYFAAGASAVSFGASVFRKDWLNKDGYKKIGKAIKAFVDAYHSELPTPNSILK